MNKQLLEKYIKELAYQKYTDTFLEIKQIMLVSGKWVEGTDAMIDQAFVEITDEVDKLVQAASPFDDNGRLEVLSLRDKPFYLVRYQATSKGKKAEVIDEDKGFSGYNRMLVDASGLNIAGTDSPFTYYVVYLYDKRIIEVLGGRSFPLGTFMNPSKISK